MNNGRMIIGFALGALAGAALSCFAHSNRGRKMRKDLYQTIHDLRSKGGCCKACECGEECECEHPHGSMEESLK
jgi:hypothetical protein